MIHELLPGLLAVTDVPKGDHGFFIHLKVLWTDYRYKGVFMKTLPPGTWSILGIGTADKITEQEWKPIVNGEMKIEYVDHNASGGGLIECAYYVNYETMEAEFETATESGLSLLKSHNLNPSTTILLISKKYIYGK